MPNFRKFGRPRRGQEPASKGPSPAGVEIKILRRVRESSASSTDATPARWRMPRLAARPSQGKGGVTRLERAPRIERP